MRSFVRASCLCLSPTNLERVLYTLQLHTLFGISTLRATLVEANVKQRESVCQEFRYKRAARARRRFLSSIRNPEKHEELAQN